MEKCACKGTFLEKFIQPSILICLYNDSLHGFSVLEKLKESACVDYSGIDPAGLYRMLKKMEASGLLTSKWDLEGSPQPRRVYTITDEGKNCLAFWEKTLIEYAATINNLSKAVSESIQGGKYDNTR